jgi:hypothetical protein
LLDRVDVHLVPASFFGIPFSETCRNGMINIESHGHCQVSDPMLVKLRIFREALFPGVEDPTLADVALVLRSSA